jgi:hypothetical protein
MVISDLQLQLDNGCGLKSKETRKTKQNVNQLQKKNSLKNHFFYLSNDN